MTRAFASMTTRAIARSVERVRDPLAEARLPARAGAARGGAPRRRRAAMSASGRSAFERQARGLRTDTLAAGALYPPMLCRAR
jgi:hypothetical protein